MGVPGLWQQLAAHGTPMALEQLAWNHLCKDRSCRRMYRMGIDASQWMYHAKKSCGGAQPELRALFFRLARFFNLPIYPIFVLDGPHKPTIKRNAHVSHAYQPLEARFCALLTDLGFVYWRAYAEAEAELAWMNLHGLIDGVLTDDVDALMFGSACVLRPSTHDTSSDLLTVYDTREAAWDLDRDAMVLVAVLSGGDYDTHGLVHCGIKTAVALARAGFGSALTSAFRTHFPPQCDPKQLATSSPAWDTFLAAWRRDMRTELRSNSHGHLSRCQPKLAASINDAFLSTANARRYLFDYIWPRTSEYDAMRSASLVARLARVPPYERVDLHALAQTLQQSFLWTPSAVLDKLERLLLDGVYVRELIAAANTDKQVNAQDNADANKRLHEGTLTTSSTASPSVSVAAKSAPKPIVDELSVKLAAMQVHAFKAFPEPSLHMRDIHSMRTKHGRLELRVSYDADTFVNGLAKAMRLQHASSAATVRRVWLPVPLLLAQGKQLSERVRAYLAARKRSKYPTDLSWCDKGPSSVHARGERQTRLTSFMTHGPSAKTCTPIHEKSVDDDSCELIRVVYPDVIVLSDSSLSSSSL